MTTEIKQIDFKMTIDGKSVEASSGKRFERISPGHDVVVGTYPNVLLSSIDPMYSITIVDAMSGSNSLIIILWVTGIFFPIILGYQSWKYLRFRDKVKLNDE